MEQPDSLSTTFTWPIATDGYRWSLEPTLDGDGRSLVRGGPILVPVTDRARRYRPLREEPTLFLALAEVPPTRSAIRAFANRYGQLTTPPMVARSGPVVLGESIAVWQGTIRALRAAVTRWRDPVSQRPYASPAMVDLQRMVNHYLRGAVSAQLFGHDAEKALRLAFAPTDLRAALWLQLARAIGWDKAYKRCALIDCGKPFEVSRERATGSRVSRTYCSDTCKQRAYRQRKADEIAAEATAFTTAFLAAWETTTRRTAS